MSGRLRNELFADYKNIIRTDEPLAPHTWFRIGGPAAWFAAPRAVDEVEGLVDVCRSERVPWRVLGRGTNVLVRDEGVEGLVIHLDREAFGCIERTSDAVTCGAAAGLTKLVQRACRDWRAEGYAALAGIPGSVGGALRMNAGGKHGSIGALVEWVRVLEPDGDVNTLRKSDVEFGYRTSSLAGRVVLAAEFVAPEGSAPDAAEHAKSIFEEKRRTQPLAAHSAGCVFANPTTESGATLSAGRLIDELGFKGRAIGDAVVSDVHANFIINRGHASAADVLGLVELIRSEVKAAHGVDLRLEIEVW